MYSIPENFYCFIISKIMGVRQIGPTCGWADWDASSEGKLYLAAAKGMMMFISDISTVTH